MHEQLLFELPEVADSSPEHYQSVARKSAPPSQPNESNTAVAGYVGGHFIFKFRNDDPDFTSGLHDIRQPLDISQLSPALTSALPNSDFVIVNVATWWTTRTVGSIIDIDGQEFAVDGGVQEEEDGSHRHGEFRALDGSFHDRHIDFATLMERGLHLMLAHMKKGAVLVWRSESLTDCNGLSFRQSIVPVLHRMRIPILNISEATCEYIKVQHNQTDGIHLCFPSVALRHWLKLFETQFL